MLPLALICTMMTTEHLTRLSVATIEADACLCSVAIGWMPGYGASMAGWSTWFPALSRPGRESLLSRFHLSGDEPRISLEQHS